VTFIVILFIFLIFSLLLTTSSIKESPSGDELAHIFSGYSYVKTGEWRFNLEHPPLIKDLSGMSLRFFENPVFPNELFNNIKAGFWGWQWEMGGKLIYEINNNSDLLLFLARFPVMVLSLIFLVIIFIVTKKYYGVKGALAASILYAFSPNIIAHSRYVTTDIGISLFYFLSVITLVMFLEERSRRNLIFFMLSLFGSLITKFSFVTLFPTLFVIFLAHPFWSEKKPKELFKNYWTAIKPLLFAVFGALVLTIIFLELHTLKMSYQEVKMVITDYIPSNIYNVQKILLEMAKIVKGLPLYLTGFLYVTKHSLDGHTAYLWGKLYNQGLWYYFPTVFFAKTQLVFFALSGFWIFLMAKTKKMNFIEFSAIIGVVIYFGMSITNKMNIGVRHLLPIYPLLFLLLGGIFTKLDIFGQKKKVMEIIIWVLLGIYALEAIMVFPYYTQYTNQIITNPKVRYKYFVDSNLDWGQSLKELGKIVREKGYGDIIVDYFANGTPVNYYVPEANIWDGKSTIYTKYFAVSATSYQFYPDRYRFLNGKEPIDEAGYSILIFQNKE